MSENATTQTQESTQVSNDDLGATLWGKKNSTENKTDTTTQTTNTKEISVKQPEKKEEIKVENTSHDYNSFLKEKFGFDSVEMAQEAFSKLKTETKPEPIKYANETTQKIFEAAMNSENLEEFEDVFYNHIYTKKQLKDIEKLSPADRLKLHIKFEHPDYNNTEINDLFEELYNVGEKPEFDETQETEDQFKKRLSRWERENDHAKRRMERDSKDALNELKQIQEQNKLIIPEIKKVNANPDQDKQTALQLEKERTNYLKNLDDNYKSFKGYNLIYKDKDVEVPINYDLTEQEQLALKQNITDFDHEDYFDKRWFDKDGNPNVRQIMSDRYALDNLEKVLQKVANDTWGKAFDYYVNKVKNVDIKETNETQSTVNNQPKTESQVLSEAVWKRQR